ncbi:uncharacterized protein [Scyliorhinus torazame]|uniref:uncharacterized protein isoform X3 n=1 Tax=Scyliorhinus torazame TaxID=75743 RepID=UPI003B5946A7
MGIVGTILKLFSITLGVCLSTFIIEGPKNAFVLLNSDATFNCTVSQPWHVIIWLMNGAPVLTIIPKGPIVTDPQYGQRNYTTQDRFTSELVITAVTLKNNATVQCNLQTDGHQQARLFVQANQDKTWLIVAIVVPIIGVILLIILIIIIVCCIKRSKHTESSYQNELRKISRKKSLEATGNGLNKSGLENFGVSAESIPSSHQIDSWPGSMNNDALETPEGPTSNRGTQKATINQYMPNIPTYPRKTRHVTAV